jgi:hypothetical protein
MLSEAHKLAATLKPPGTRLGDLALISERVVMCNLRWFALPSEAASLMSKGPLVVNPLQTVHVLPHGRIILVPYFVQRTVPTAAEPAPAPACPLLVRFPQASKPSAVGDGVDEVLEDSAEYEDVAVDVPEAAAAKEQPKAAADNVAEVAPDVKKAAVTARAAVVGNNKKLFPTVPKSLMRLSGMAVRDFEMIKEGDRVLLGLSGGKDSLTLLHILHSLQKRAPIRFELAAVTMDPQFPGFDPSPLVGYMKSLGIPYFFESQPLLKLAEDTKPTSICAWCSRMKRE